MLRPRPTPHATAPDGVGRVRTVPPAVVASTLPWPAIVLVVALAAALCLWGLFRRGSVADRARHDATAGATNDPDDDVAPPRPTSPG
jgi:hypothetical protein